MSACDRHECLSHKRMFEILQHTADVRLRVRAASVEELFRDAMRGMFAIMNSAASEGARRHTRLRVDSVDRTSLLVDFLSEVLTHAQIDRCAFDEVKFESLSEVELDATISGLPARFEQDVKAVTYHEAEVLFVSGVWQTMLVFDI